MLNRLRIKKLPKFIWAFLSQILIGCYMLFAPINVEINIVDSLMALLSGSGLKPLGPGAFYIVPIIVFLAVIIFGFRISRISSWIGGTIFLFFILWLCVDFFHITENVFDLTFNFFFSASIIAIPFWCIFFFLWELLFCIIEKLCKKTATRSTGDH